MKDSYKTISEKSESEFKDRGSKFFAYAFPVYSEADWHSALDTIKSLHPKARHFCYAYRLGTSGNQFRANDDGEPSGTAGKPILGQIDSFGLTNVFVVVVRYFGGTLLGTSGLINAYRTSTAEAFKQADIIEKIVVDIYELIFEYSIMSEVMNGVKKLKLEIVLQDFGNIGKLQIALRQSEVEEKLIALKAQILKKSINEAQHIEEIENLQIRFSHTK